ncbi:MAG: Phytol kinase, partial [bacterium]|nr:Phytol kinase [bacterium]
NDLVNFTSTLAGALVVGVVAAFAGGRPLRVVWIAVVAGTAGALVDSLLGATVQETFYCRGCARECESARHHCGADAERRRGVIGFGNDLVNFTSTLAGALVGAALY